MAIVKEEFPPEFIALAQEVRNHPNLILNLNDDFAVSLAKIAAYCEVILDGIYTYEDQIAIAARLTDQLRKSRVAILS